jgi:hypothetical protein
MDDKPNSVPPAGPPPPSDGAAGQPSGEIERAALNPPAQSGGPASIQPPQSWLSHNAPILVFVTLGFTFLGFVSWGTPRILRAIASFASEHNVKVENDEAPIVGHSIDAETQAKAEELLGRVAAGDLSAADQMLDQSDGWTGKTHRTPKTDQFITADLNLKDLHARAAAIQAQLALDGIPRDDTGLAILEQSVGNPTQRAWALWNLGALGNRGVNPVHTAKVIAAYLNDPDANVRANAVNGLALLATDETIPMLLDRFRNDPSNLVQEPAACALAESGMYTHEQRLVAAASMVGWLDDSLLTQQQRTWTVQALRDISGQNFGSDAAAWRRWHDGAH